MRRTFILAVVAVGLAGCASPPSFDAPQDDEAGPTVALIVDKIQCEIAEARDNPANDNEKLKAFLNQLGIAEFGKWVASATLTLTVSDTEGLTPTSSGLNITAIQPLKHVASSFLFGGGIVLYQLRSRIYSQAYTIRIAEIPPNQTCESMKRKWHDINLEGDLGLKEQIYMGLHAFTSGDADVYDIPKSGSPDNFGATTSFDVFKGVTNLGPTWTLAHFKGPVGGLGYVRDDLHKIAITFQPVAHVPHKELLAPKELSQVRRANEAAVISAARRANENLVNTQNIQSLGQILNRQ